MSRRDKARPSSSRKRSQKSNDILLRRWAGRKPVLAAGDDESYEEVPRPSQPKRLSQYLEMLYEKRFFLSIFFFSLFVTLRVVMLNFLRNKFWWVSLFLLMKRIQARGGTGFNNWSVNLQIREWLSGREVSKFLFYFHK